MDPEILNRGISRIQTVGEASTDLEKNIQEYNVHVKRLFDLNVEILKSINVIVTNLSLFLGDLEALSKEGEKI
ncbi:MAG: hypothetical protein H3Z53_12370 [archaeon]|nr:hypothetical protein [archaeon]MCP8315144.1 hypothetical protein [archaeon]